MNYKLITSEINYDIEQGIYNQFPVLRERLLFIAKKLTLCCYCEDEELSKGEIKTLEENEYL